MGKDTGGNRKSGRAGGGATAGADIGAGAPQAGGTPLDAKQTGAFAKGFTKAIFGTTNAKVLRDDHGVAVKVEGDGTLAMTAIGWLTSSAVASLNTRQGWLNNYAASNGFSITQIGDTVTELGMSKTASSKATRLYKVAGGG